MIFNRCSLAQYSVIKNKALDSPVLASCRGKARGNVSGNEVKQMQLPEASDQRWKK